MLNLENVFCLVWTHFLAIVVSPTVLSDFSRVTDVFVNILQPNYNFTLPIFSLCLVLSLWFLQKVRFKVCSYYTSFLSCCSPRLVANQSKRAHLHLLFDPWLEEEEKDSYLPNVIYASVNAANSAKIWTRYTHSTSNIIIHDLNASLKKNKKTPQTRIGLYVVVSESCRTVGSSCTIQQKYVRN